MVGYLLILMKGRFALMTKYEKAMLAIAILGLVINALALFRFIL